MNIYVIKNENGERFCKDMKWRDFAHFGTFKECIKEYKNRKWATKLANKLKGKNTVVWLPSDRIMDASGKVFEI